VAAPVAADGPQDREMSKSPPAREALTVEWWPADRPVPYEGNPRVISDAAVEKVALSIGEYGWRQPIVVDEAGAIVAGHTRLLAAKNLGRETVPVHIASVSRHAKAPKAWVDLDLGPGRVHLLVGDDGRGFDPSVVEASHIGLESMRERASQVAAELDIVTKPGRGTVVTLDWHEG
jgi:hypothetical protein